MFIHICNNYISSKVHSNIVKAMDNSDCLNQYVFIPVKNKYDKNKNIYLSDKVEYDYSFCNFSFLKFLPLIKVFLISIFFIKSMRGRECNHILAHNMWTDGFSAFIYSLIFKTKYSLIIRNTDMNIFIPKLIHYHFLMRLMIKKSDNLIFISKAYEIKFKKKYPYLYNVANTKTIWNGVDDYWLENRINSNIEREAVVAYVGRFTKNKNLENLVKAIRVCKNQVKLIVIGGELSELLKVLNMNELPSFIDFHNQTENKEYIKNIYRRARVLVMPSRSETFGLTYIEALTQGCSVIHSIGQGIDGIFEVDYIRGVDPENIHQISMNIDFLIDKFPNGIPLEFVNSLDNDFKWNKIATKYVELDQS